jgi:hypothetical protein
MNQQDRTNDALSTIHSALVLCRDLAADAVDREAKVAKPIARYRLDRVNEALALVRREMGIEPETIEAVVGRAAEKLSTLPPNEWIRLTRHFLKTLKGQATEVEWRAFLERMLADVELGDSEETSHT